MTLGPADLAKFEHDDDCDDNDEDDDNDDYDDDDDGGRVDMGGMHHPLADTADHNASRR